MADGGSDGENPCESLRKFFCSVQHAARQSPSCQVNVSAVQRANSYPGRIEMTWFTPRISRRPRRGAKRIVGGAITMKSVRMGACVVFCARRAVHMPVQPMAIQPVGRT